ncbi:TRZ/ATZ family hydrolase [Methylobacillus flagellatus]|uniref:TRZ/ATZ family hydrolase n=1 Tax=Methylobacillus flagellatus TaxID=405 RepID=UPI0010F6071A|nr:TRZ/ATZ family hydrolase [Methylobacillus flagellatus]
MNKPCDLIIEARWLVPVEPKNVVLEHHSVVVQAGRIIDLLPTALARQQYQSLQRTVLDDSVLIPGLINLHTHAAMTLIRGLADDLPLMPWLQQHIWPAEQRWVSHEFVRDGTLLACAEMLRAGVTCFNDMYFHPAAAEQAVAQAGMRANLGLVVMDFPTSYAVDAEDYLHQGLAARDGWRGNPLVTASLAPHAPYTLSDASFEHVVMYAEQLGLGIHTHLHETQDEITQSLQLHGRRPMQRMVDLGVLSPGLIAAHCVHMTQDDMDLLRAHGGHIAHCPASNLKLASGMSPVAAMQAAGLNIGIGTDGAASNNRLDMFAEMRLAALLAKGVAGDATAVPAGQALSMATINAARALGLDDRVGSIEVGKFADLTALRMDDIETLPCYDVLSHVVYVLGREHVSHVWVSGDLRYQKLPQQDGLYANIEAMELREISSKWYKKLKQSQH